MATDLTSKYQKLGQEYQKVRAQVAVLKKAVIDEQGSNRNYQEMVKQKDQAIRKYEQEIDSLQFRNDQLSKRVEILQCELDEVEKKVGKTKAGADFRQIDNSAVSVKEEELLMKIKENEVLHQQLNDAEQQHQIVVQRLEDRLAFLEREREGHEKVVEEANSRYSRVIERLQEDRSSMESKTKKQEEELKIANIMADKYQQQLKGVHKDLKEKLEKTSNILKQKLPFNDTERKDWNILNVPVCDRSHQLQSRSLVCEFTGIFNNFLSSLSDFLTYLGQRVQVYSLDIKQEDASLLCQKLVNHLHGNCSYIREVTESITELNDFVQKEFFVSLETCVPLQNLSSAFNKLIQYLKKIMPYFKLSITDEYDFPSCTDQLENLTKEVAKFIAKMSGSLQRLGRYLHLLVLFARNPSSSNTSASCFKHLHSHLSKLSSGCQELCTNYYLKSEEEQKLPLMTERIINTDKCILKSLTSMSSAAVKMLKFFDTNVTFMCRGSAFKRKGFTGEEEQGLTTSAKLFQTKASSYLQGLQKDAEESIPYSIAVHNYKTLVTSTESRDTLARQVLSSHETLSRLEQEKEHWMLEAQLLKVKYEKEVKRVAVLGEELKKAQTDVEQRFSGVATEALEDNIQKSLGSGTTPRSPSVTSVASVQDPVAFAPQVGTLEIMSEDNDKVTDDAHEAMMKDHLTGRISGLTRQAQQSDSKAVAFYAECRALYKQLVLADRSKKRTDNELAQANKVIEELQDVLETTKRSYEEQLRTLSDHLCGMNEQLASQKEKAEAAKTPSKTRISGGLGRKK